MTNSLPCGHKCPSVKWLADYSSYCSLGMRRKRSRTGCPASSSKCIVIVSRIGPVDKGKNSAETRRGIGSIVNMEIKKMAFAILLRFRAMAARRHSSVAARMPLFRIFEMQCSRFKTEKLPSAQILRSRIMDRYSGVLTL